MGEWEECELGRGLCVGVWGRSGMHLGGVGMLQGHPEVARGVLDTSRMVVSSVTPKGQASMCSSPRWLVGAQVPKTPRFWSLYLVVKYGTLERGPLLTCT